MRMLDVVETHSFRNVACATTAPMRFQLLESEVLLELLELLLVELCRAALTLSSNSCLRQGISFFHVGLVECPLLLLYCVKSILTGRGPWPWSCAELALGFRENRALFSERPQAVADVVQDVVQDVVSKLDSILCRLA